jgi:hypothetical protein
MMNISISKSQTISKICKNHKSNPNPSPKSRLKIQTQFQAQHSNPNPNPKGLVPNPNLLQDLVHRYIRWHFVFHHLESEKENGKKTLIICGRRNFHISVSYLCDLDSVRLYVIMEIGVAKALVYD